jgi:hypothetical protein
LSRSENLSSVILKPSQPENGSSTTCDPAKHGPTMLAKIEGAPSSTTNGIDFDSSKIADLAAQNEAHLFYRLINPISHKTVIYDDLAIGGKGFFLVKDPNSGELFVTRAGYFLLDAAQFLTTKQGLRVQGYITANHSTAEQKDQSEIGDTRNKYWWNCEMPLHHV